MRVIVKTTLCLVLCVHLGLILPGELYGSGGETESRFSVNTHIDAVTYEGFARGNSLSLGSHYWWNKWLDASLCAGMIYNLRTYRNELPDLFRAEIAITLHGRFFPYIHPYVAVAGGREFLLEDTGQDNLSFSFRKSGLFPREGFPGAVIREGLALEYNRLTVTLESSQRLGKIERYESKIGVAYTLKSSPYRVGEPEFKLSEGMQFYNRIIGAYHRTEGFTGHELIFTSLIGERKKVYNLGIFYTDGPEFSTGVIHGGMSKQLPLEDGVWNYVKIAPGLQVLLWLEGKPDLILPAGSLAISTEFRNGGIILYARARIIGAISPFTGLNAGVLSSMGFGLDI